MHRTPEDTVVIVTRKTTLQENLRLFQTKGQAKFVYKQKALAAASSLPLSAPSVAKKRRVIEQAVEEAAVAFGRLEQQDAAYEHVLHKIRAAIPKRLKVQQLDRAQLPQFIWAANHIPVVVGIDGLVVNTAKYLDGQPIIAINPDPETIDGILLPFRVEDFAGVLTQTMDAAAPTTDITMAEAQLDDGQRLLAFNDLFVGRSSHVSARYTLSFADRSERQSSSGIIVSTGAGSTGWMRSVIRASAEVQRELGGQPFELAEDGRFHWSAPKLRFAVREPFPTQTTGTELVLGDIKPDHPLIIESEMPEGGVIFSDGVERDYLRFPAGSRAEIRVASKVARLVVKHPATTRTSARVRATNMDTAKTT